MRFEITAAAVVLAMTAGYHAKADDACENTFRHLKQLERVQRHLQKLDIDRLLQSGALPAPCSKRQIQFDSNEAARAEDMAPVARAFVAACGFKSKHMAELELYSNDDVLHPPPGAWREGCGVADFTKPGAITSGTISR